MKSSFTLSSGKHGRVRFGPSQQSLWSINSRSPAIWVRVTVEMDEKGQNVGNCGRLPSEDFWLRREPPGDHLVWLLASLSGWDTLVLAVAGAMTLPTAVATPCTRLLIWQIPWSIQSFWVGTWGVFCWSNASELPNTPRSFRTAASGTWQKTMEGASNLLSADHPAVTGRHQACQ